jgi:hypothetical protein
VPLLFGVAGLILGLSVPLLDELAAQQKRSGQQPMPGGLATFIEALQQQQHKQQQQQQQLPGEPLKAVWCGGTHAGPERAAAG